MLAQWHSKELGSEKVVVRTKRETDVSTYAKEHGKSPCPARFGAPDSDRQVHRNAAAEFRD